MIFSLGAVQMTSLAPPRAWRAFAGTSLDASMKWDAPSLPARSCLESEEEIATALYPMALAY